VKQLNIVVFTCLSALFNPDGSDLVSPGVAGGETAISFNYEREEIGTGYVCVLLYRINRINRINKINRVIL